MSLFQRTPASWTPPQPHNREQRGGGVCSYPLHPRSGCVQSCLQPPPHLPLPQGTALPRGLTCFCFCLAWEEERRDKDW